MKPELYNPCADGFAAKLWECLRRNEQFKDECKSWSTIKSKASWAATIARLESSISPAPLFAIVRHLFLGPDIRVPIEDHFKSLSLTLKKTWPELDAENREWFLSFGAREKLERAHIPNFTVPRKNKKRADADADFFLMEARYFNDTHQLCYVPKFIWDSDHKKQIERQLEELLGKPIGNKKLLKSTGSTLCTEQDWNTFLDYEEWTRLGFERQDAANLAAERQRVIKAENPLYGVEATQGTDVELKKAAKNFLRLNKPHPHRTRAEKRISDVERAIVSIFPSFSLFSSK